MTSYMANAQTVTHDWYIVDAAGQTLGRLATAVASCLRGKHKPEFTPHVDTGDHIIVINADKIVVTGNKAKKKVYEHYTGFPGGLKGITFEKLLAKSPTRPVELAIKRMLPKGPLGYAMYSKLKVYAGAEHPHIAQQPKVLDLTKFQ